MEIRTERVQPSRWIYSFERKNLYPFLSREEMEGWMEDRGPLGVRYFVAWENGRRVGVAAWGVYDVHQYKENGPRVVILDFYVMMVDESVRGQGVGTKLFMESLRATIEELKESNFVVGALLIETVTAPEFYQKVLAHLGLGRQWAMYEMIPGHKITFFWVPLLKGQE